jgi:S-DNA-T family DNA segregation ATPase FtsK/SpoIIIE
MLLLLAALLLGLSFLPKATGVALILGHWQRLVLGQGAPAIPLLCFLTGLVVILARGHARFPRRVQGLLLGGLTLLAILHARVAPGEEFAAMRAGEGGGALGAVLVSGARALVGEIGLWLLIGLGGLVAFFLFSSIPAARLVDALAWMREAIGWILRVAGRVAINVGRQAGRAAGRQAMTMLQTGIRRARTAKDQWGAWRRARPPGPVLEMPAPAPSPVAEELPAEAQAKATLFPLEPAVGGAAPASGALQSGIAPAPPAARRRPQRVGAGAGRERMQQASLLPDPQETYELPPLTLLGEPSKGARGQRWDPSETARALERTLASFGVEAKVVRWEQGPVVTRFEVQPGSGVKVQKITSLTNDLALNLAAPSVRIEAPIPGKSAVGIEIPNQKSSLVHISEILGAEAVGAMRGSLIVGLGKDLTGHPIVADLTEMPHLLIAGTTGSGKTVALNAIIASLLFRYTPHQVRFVMIDPKRVELTNYNDIPHLLVPVVTNPRATAGALKEMLRVMEERFERFAEAGVRNIQAYNELTDATPLPFIVIVIDELADLMMVAPADFEDVIVRLAQMTRATGIHLVVATQRPSVDVITGLIKANIPSRIAFAVSSQVDSRTIIDGPGAEKLIGRGDMLFLPMGASRPVRAQGSYIADEEIQALVDWWRGQGKPAFDPNLLEAGQKMASAERSEDGERLADAARLVVRAGYGSVSLLQRKMRIGYVTAARLIDQLEERGIVGPAQGSSPREVLIGLDALERSLGPGVVRK